MKRVIDLTYRTITYDTRAKRIKCSSFSEKHGLWRARSFVSAQGNDTAYGVRAIKSAIRTPHDIDRVEIQSLGKVQKRSSVAKHPGIYFDSIDEDQGIAGISAPKADGGETTSGASLECENARCGVERVFQVNDLFGCQLLAGQLTKCASDLLDSSSGVRVAVTIIRSNGRLSVALL